MKPRQQASIWDRLVVVINNQKLAPETRAIAQMYLNQLNTAGGMELMGHEANAWLRSIGK